MSNKIGNQRGQAMMEYIIISFLVVLICIGTIRGLGGDLKEKLEGMRSSINRNLDIRKIR